MTPNAGAELRELVEDHLGRGKPDDVTIAVACHGIDRLGEVLQMIKSRSENWGAMTGLLRVSVQSLRQVLPALKAGAASAPALASLAERQLAFAELLQDEIIRLQAGETTEV